MKFVPVLAALCCALAVPRQAMAQPAQDAPKPATYLLKLRVEQDGKDTFTQEIQLQAQGTFEVATTAGGSSFTVRGSGQMRRDRMIVQLAFDLSRVTDATNAHAAAKSSVHTTIAEQPDGKEAKVGWLTTRTNNVAHEDAIWASVRKSGQ